MALPSTRTRTEEYRIEELSTMVRKGGIRIPEFQRSFRWTSSDVLSLFDSILRGYPFGSILLWRKAAPEATLVIGAIEVAAPAIPDALWVVDGQQRITSLVNAVDPIAGRDDRFALAYSLTRRRFILARDARAGQDIPLPDLFDLGRAFAWLQQNPDAADYAADIQEVTGRLRDVAVPAAVISESEEGVLRDVFDRINSAGRRLRGSEIFDAINSAAADGSTTRVSLGAIADRLDALTGFGRLPDDTVYQAVLVIRHPDLTRNIRAEFSPDRDVVLDYSDDDQSAAYSRGEAALQSAIRFLQHDAGVPHSAFVPFRFHLLVLARYFALFPTPARRNIELLSRWLWRSTALSNYLGLTGSTGNIRQLAGMVGANDEDGSVQRLLEATDLKQPIPVPDLQTFRTNNSAGKLILAALWSLGPINPATGQPLGLEDLAGALGAETSPRTVAMPLLFRGPATDAANRVISVTDRDSFFANLRPEHLSSHLLDAQMLAAVDRGDEEFLTRRGELISEKVRDFLAQRTGSGLEQTPPLSNFDFDDIDDVYDAAGSED